MSRRIAVVTILAVLTTLFLVSAQVKFDPNSIDVHWYGLPLPPCFVDAKACEGHVLGTDDIGRDVLARLVYGGQVSLGLSLIAVAMELALGIVFGMLARYGGAVLKFVIMRSGDAISCFPAWPFLVVMVFVGTPPSRASLPGFVLVAITGILFSPQIARLIATVGDVRTFVPAASNLAARDLTRIIVLLATVDFFGLGIQPPTASWGNMLTNAQENITIAWWVGVFPAICIFGAVLAIEIVRRRFLASDVKSHEPTLT